MVKKARGKHRLDKFYHLAKEQGYRSRAAFKLIQLNRKYGFLNNARACLDLCAAPGGWLQVAAQNMPVSSLVIGVDLAPIRPIRGVKTFVEDITTQKCRQTIKKEAGSTPLDVVLHDGAPNVGGAWQSEAYTQAALVLEALKLAAELLRPGGAFVTKVFRSKDYNALLYAFNQLFTKVEATKPAASRNTSAEIFVACLGYKAPAKIDPRLFDPKHLFQDVSEAPKVMGPDALLRQKQKQRRHREGYEDGLSTTRKVVSILSFVFSDAPVELMGQATEFSFDDKDVNPDEVKAVDDAPAALQAVIQHGTTDDEIKTYCKDLQVLGRSEFKQLLRWRLKVRKDVLAALQPAKSDKAAAADGAADGETAAVTATPIDTEEQLLNEMESIKARMEQRLRRQKKHRREMKKKLKVRAAQLAQQEGIVDEQHPDEEQLFSINVLKTGEAVNSVGDAAALDDGELQAVSRDSDDDDDDQHDDAADDSGDSDDDDALRYEALVDQYLENSYQQFLQRRGTAKKTESKRRKRLGMDGELDDGNDSVDDVDVQRYDGSDDDDDGALVVKFDDSRAGVAKSATAAAAQWFSQDLFNDPALAADEENDDDDDYGGRPARRAHGRLPAAAAAARPDSDDEIDDAQPSTSGGSPAHVGIGVRLPVPSADDSEPSAQKRGVKRRAAAAANGLPGTIANGAHKGADHNNDDANDDDEPLFGAAKRRQKQSKHNAALSKSVDDDADGFEVVPQQEFDSDGDHSTDTEDEFAALDNDAKSEVMALAKRMLRNKDKQSILEAAYNRYAFHDEDLPKWFVDDEKVAMQAEAPITKAEVEEQKALLRAIDARPIKKVAEARARRRKRLQVKMQAAQQKAEVIAAQEDVPMRSKMREIEKLYAKARSSGKGKKKLSRSGEEKAKKKGPPLDRRLLKDKRGLAKAQKRGGGKGGKAGRGGGKAGRRR